MKRVRNYDVMRVICFCIIIYCHIAMQLSIDEICDTALITRMYTTSNMHIGTMAVSVFFILSGASLGLTTKGRFSVGSYYKKRLVRLLVPFYLATAVCMSLVLAAGIHMPNFDPANTPKWRLIFTLTGMDTWLTMFHVKTFSLGIGEWFLGELVILSVLFPVFRMLIRKYPKAFLAGTVALYIATVLLYEGGCFADIAPHLNILLKGSEFIAGIYLGIYRERISSRCWMVTVPLWLLLALWPVTLPISEGIKITILSMCFFLTFSCMEGWLQKRKLKLVNLLSGCSYELFLCHHMVIYLVCHVLEPRLSGSTLIIVMVAAELIGMAITTAVLKLISDRVVGLILKR